MNNISVIGLDLAKNVFQVHGVDAHGEVVIRKRLKRRDVRKFFAQLEPCLIGMEACGGMHYWSRELTALGHCVRAMAPRFIKPYLKSNKNDRHDAAAICETVQRPHMRFVPVKTVAQQAILHLHHSRRLLLQMRVGLTNHVRGLLLEYGVAVPRGTQALTRRLPELLEDADNGIPMPVRHLVAELRDEHRYLEQRIARLEAQLKAWHARNGASQRLASIPGIGLLTATALAATVGDGKAFANGRQLAAYLGLVPRQASSGGSARLLGISKRGDG